MTKAIDSLRLAQLRGRFSPDYRTFEVKGLALQSLGVGITVRGERVGDAE